MARSFTAEVVNNLNVATRDYVQKAVSLLNIDNVVQARLMKKSKPVEGGKQIGYALRTQKENVASHGKYDPYNLQVKEILDEAKYDWKFVNGSMVLAKADVEVINTGAAQIIDIARTKVENMKDTMSDKFAQMLYTSVAGMASTDPDSLIKICATQNNTVGGINAAVCVGGSGTITEPYRWNPYLLDLTTQALVYDDLVDANHAYYIEKILRKIVGQLTLGQDKPTMMITTQGVWDSYEEVLKASKRYEGAMMEVDGGFLGLKFRGIPLVVDNNCPGGQLNATGTNSAMILVLNENYLGYKHSPRMDFKWTPWHELETQPVLHSLLEWGGTFGCNRRDRQGAVLGLPDDATIYA
jgi:hypothetical protein